MKLDEQKLRIDQLEENHDASARDSKCVQLKIDASRRRPSSRKPKRYHREDCVVRAPTDGTIVRLSAAKGMLLGPGTPLEPAIVFAPAGPLVVRAEVEQADAGRD